MNGNMSDDEIRQHIGLSKEQLSEVQTKFDAFVKSLSSPEQQVFQNLQKKRLQDAAHELGGGVTASQLENVLRGDKKQLVYICIICRLINGGKKHHE